MRAVAVLGLLVALVLTDRPADAITRYVYAGPFFTDVFDDTPPAGTYTTAMRVTGWFEVATPLPGSQSSDITADLLAFSFHDGRTTIDDSTPDLTIDRFTVQTTSSGAILHWDIQVSSGAELVPLSQFYERLIATDSTGTEAGVIAQCVGGDPPCDEVDVVFDAGEVTSPLALGGSWSAIPEPSTALLVGVGLLGLAHWRRSSVSDPRDSHARCLRRTNPVRPAGR